MWRRNQSWIRRVRGFSVLVGITPTAVVLTWGLGVLGEEIKEPEVDLSTFLEKQRLSDSGPLLSARAPEEDEDEIDHTLAHITSRKPASQPKKGRVQTIEWDDAFEQMSRDKAAAEANRGSSVVRIVAQEPVDDCFAPASFVV